MENFNNEKYVPLVNMTKYQSFLSRHNKALLVSWGVLLAGAGLSGITFIVGNIIQLGYQLVNDSDTGLYLALLNLIPICMIIAILMGIIDEAANRYSYLHPIDTESQKTENWQTDSIKLTEKIYLYLDNEKSIYREYTRNLILVISGQVLLLLFANANPVAISNRYALIAFSSLVFAYCLMEIWYRTVYRKISLTNQED